MSTRILGVGIGVFIIAFIWCLALILSVFLYRLHTLFAFVFTASAGIITAILFSIPFQDENTPTTYIQDSIHQITDAFFIPRIVILMAEIVAAIVGCGLLFHQISMQPRSVVQYHPKRHAIQNLH